MQNNVLKSNKNYRKKINASFVALIMLLSTMTAMVAFFATPVAAEEATTEASIWTTDIDGNIKTDFSPGEIVYINGEGFTPDKTINMSMERPDGTFEYADSNPRFINGEPSSDNSGCFELLPYDLDGITGNYTIDANDGANIATYPFTDTSQTVLTYKNSGRTNRIAVFHQGDTVYDRATTPNTNDYYVHEWKNQGGTIIRTSPCIRGSSGGKDDSVTVNSLGTWTVTVYRYNDAAGTNLDRTYGPRNFYVVSDSKIIPTDDSWVRWSDSSHHNHKDSNYGQDESLHIKWKGYHLDRRRTYLQFDIPSIPPGSVLTAANLYLYKYTDVGNSDVVGVYDVDGSWNESTITWNNQPDSSDWRMNWTIPSAKGYTHIDVKDAIEGNALNLELKFNPEEKTKHQDFYSTEEDDKSDYKGPYLEIMYEEATCPPRPAGLDLKIDDNIRSPTSIVDSRNQLIIMRGDGFVDIIATQADGDPNHTQHQTSGSITFSGAIIKDMKNNIQNSCDSVDNQGDSSYSLGTPSQDEVFYSVGSNHSEFYLTTDPCHDWFSFDLCYLDSCPTMKIDFFQNSGDTITEIVVLNASGNVVETYSSGDEIPLAVDSDGDGIADYCDECPGFNDSLDSDGDGIPDGCDNCVNTPNPDQTDSNDNGIGDACENIDFGDAPSPYPTLLADNGARHKIGGPYLGSIAPDAETDGQPDPNALGDDNDGNDDENGVTIPPLEIGTTNTITINVSGGGYVNAWIDYDQDGTWQHPTEEVYNGSLSDGTHQILINVPSGLSTGTTYARFRINSEGYLSPFGEAKDGEVEDYKVTLQDTNDPEQTIEFGNPKEETGVWGNLFRVSGNTPIYINSTDFGTGTEYMVLKIYKDDGQNPYDPDPCNPNNYANPEIIYVYDKNESNAGSYNGLDTDVTFGRIAVNLTIDESCFHEIDAYCYDRAGNENIVKRDFIVDANGPTVEHTIGNPNCTSDGKIYVNRSTEIALTAEDFMPFCENCTAGCVDTIYWNITYDNGDTHTQEYSEPGDTATFTFTEECHHVVYYWAYDCLGNKGPVYGPFDFYVDETPPTSGISFDPNCIDGEKTYIRNDTSITISADDNNGGCTVGTTLIHYRVWANGQWTSWMTGQINQNVTFTLEDLGMPWSNDCTHYIEYWAEDCLHNTEAPIHNETVYVDNTGPEKVEMNWGSPSYVRADGKIFVKITTPITLSWPEDQIQPCTSGTTTVYYQIWYKGVWTSPKIYEGEFNFTENCTHKVKAWAVDCLGNVGEANITTFYVDEEPPLQTSEFVPPPYQELQESGYTWYWISNGTVKIITATDRGCGVGGAGVYKLTWVIENETDTLVSGVVYDDINCNYSDRYVTVTGDNDPRPGVISINVSIEESCHHFILHNAEDYLGNSMIVKQQVYVDTLPPVIIKTIDTPHYTPEWIQEDDYFVTNQTCITINATDNESNYPCNVSSVHMLVGIEYPTGIWNYTWYNVTEGTAHCDFTFEEAGVGEECMHNVTIYAEDDVGNSLWYDNETFYVDNTPPDAIKIIGDPHYDKNLPAGATPGEDYYVRGDTPITIKVKDNGTEPCIVGSTYLHYRIWYNGVWTQWNTLYEPSGGITETFTFNDFSLGDDCVHYLEYYVEDNLGNRWPAEGYDNETFYVDNTPPVVTKEVGNPQYPAEQQSGDYYITKDTPIYINVTEQGTEPCIVGSTTLYYSILYKGIWYNDTIHHEKADGPINLNFTFAELAAYFVVPELADDCEHVLRIWAEDDLGNHWPAGAEYHEETFYVDNTPPKVTKEVGEPKCDVADEPGNYYVTSHTPIYINATDNQTKGCAVNSTHIKFTLTYDGRTESWWENDTCDGIQNLVYTFEGLSCDLSWPELGNDCKHTLTYEAWDDLGNYFGPHTETFYVDNQPPDHSKEIGEPKYKGDLDEGDWYVTSNTPIWINATDNTTFDPCVVGSVHLHYRVYYYKTQTYTQWENISVDSGTLSKMITLDGECLHRLDYWIEDDLGNSWPENGWHKEYFYVDNSEPDVVKTVGEPKYNDGTLPKGDWYITNQTPITIDVTDNGTEPCIVGSTHLYYAIEYKGTWYNYSIHHEKTDGPIHFEFTFESLATQFGIPIADDCVHKLRIWAEDNLGNHWPADAEYHEEIFYVDNTPSVVTKEVGEPKCDVADEPGNYYVTSHTPIYINATDNQTKGCAVNSTHMKFELTYDGKTKVWWVNDTDDGIVNLVYTFDSLAAQLNWPELGNDCEHILTYEAWDDLGNYFGPHTETFYVDNTPPEIIKTVGEPSISDDGGTWWVTTDTEVNLTAHDLECPCAVGGVTLWYNISYRTLDNYTGWLPYTENITFDEHCTHYLHVKAVDCLGNTNYDNETFVVHGEIDQIPTLQSPADGSTISDNTTTFDWNDVVGQSRYRLQYADNINFVDAVTVNIVGKSNYTIPEALALEDGIWYWHVAVLYTGGVVGQYSDTWWFDVDANAPIITIDPISSPVKDILEITTTTDPDVEDVVFEYSMYNNGPWHTLGTDDTAPFSMTWDTTSVGDGYYYVKATATDDAGQTGFDIEGAFEIDNGIAGVPTLIQPADGSLLSYKPILLWNAVEDASGYHIEIYDDFDNSGLQNLIVSADVTSTSYDTYTLGLTDNNEYYWRVAALDSDGNQMGQYSSTWWFMVDLNAPEIDNVAISDSDGTVVVGDTVMFTVEEYNDEAGLTGTLEINGETYGLVDNNNGDYTFTWHIPEDYSTGTYTVTATLEDAVGHTDTDSTLEITIIKTSGPTSHIIEAVVVPNLKTMQFLAELTSDEAIITAAQYRIDLTGGLQDIPAGWLTDGSYNSTHEYIQSLDIDISSLSDGEHVLFVRAQDENGNWGAFDEEEFIVDTTAPIVTITNPTEGTQTGANFELNVETNEDATCTYQIDGSSWQTMTNTGSITHSTDIGPLSDGQHTITVNATDVLGNGPSLDTVTWTVTLTGPTTSGTDVEPDSSIVGTQLEITATIHSTISEVVDAEYFIGSKGASGTGTPLNPTDGTWDGTSENVNGTIDTTGWSAGEYKVYVHGLDANGHWGAFDEEEFTLVEASQWRPVIVNILEPKNNEEINVTCTNKNVTVVVDAYRPYYNGLPEDHALDVYVWLDQPYGAPDLYYDVTYHSNPSDPYYERFTAEIPVYMYSSGSELNLEAKAEDDYGNRAYDDTTFSVITTIEYDLWLREGWNGPINIALEGCSNATEDVLASIDPYYDFVFEVGTWDSLWNNQPNPEWDGGTLQTIQRDGWYWIHMTDAARLYIDSTCPDISISGPPQEINNQCFDISGYACDTETGVEKVTTTIMDEGGCYWNGTSWTETKTFLPCSYDELTHIWTYAEDIDLTYKSGEKIIITAYATDYAGCTCYDTSFFYFNDTGDPMITIANPENITYECDGPSLINGTAQDSACETIVDHVNITIRENKTGPSYRYWNGTAWVETETELACDYDGLTHEWVYNGNLPDWENGTTYTVFAYAYDLAGNKGSAHVYYSYEEEPPDLILEKTVWNGTAWAEATDANLDDIVTFNITIAIHETGCALTDGYLEDYLPYGLEYVDNSTDIKFYHQGVLIDEISGEDCNPEITAGAGYNLLKWDSQQGYGETVPTDSIIYLEFSAKVVVGDGEFVNIANATGYYDCCHTISAEDNASVLVECLTETFDFGDAPSPYPTLLTDNGARHGGPDVVFAPYMGVGVDPDSDGQPTANADGDDNDGWDDEDGVTFISPLYPGGTGYINVSMNWTPYGGYLNAWIDFNRDGDWNDAGEQIFTNHYLSNGSFYELSFPIPNDAVLGNTYARFRISTQEGLSYDGAAPDGEVEDYKIIIEEPPCEPSHSFEKWAYCYNSGEWQDSQAGSTNPENNASFKLILNNTGICPITGVKIHDRLPASLYYDDGDPYTISSPLSHTFEQSGKDLYWNFTGNLQPGENITIIFDAMYDGDSSEHWETNEAWGIRSYSLMGGMDIGIRDTVDVLFNWWSQPS